jgi:hypothetical protein
MDDQRDHAEEQYNRELCPGCGTSPCGWDGVTPDPDHPEPKPTVITVTLTLTMSPGDRAAYAREYGLVPAGAAADFADNLPDAIREHLTAGPPEGCYMIGTFTTLDVQVAEPA